MYGMGNNNSGATMATHKPQQPWLQQHVLSPQVIILIVL